MNVSAMIVLGSAGARPDDTLTVDRRGWRAYGLRVAAEARASGRAFRVIRRKNPPRSMVVYRDAWQVALLPDRDKPIGYLAGYR